MHSVGAVGANATAPLLLLSVIATFMVMAAPADCNVVVPAEVDTAAP